MAVTARLPGVRAQDLRIGLSRDELRVETSSPEGVQGFSLALPSPVDERRATLRFTDGVLSLYLPKLQGGASSAPAPPAPPMVTR